MGSNRRTRKLCNRGSRSTSGDPSMAVDPTSVPYDTVVRITDTIGNQDYQASGFSFALRSASGHLQRRCSHFRLRSRASAVAGGRRSCRGRRSAIQHHWFDRGSADFSRLNDRTRRPMRTARSSTVDLWRSLAHRNFKASIVPGRPARTWGEQRVFPPCSRIECLRRDQSPV